MPTVTATQLMTDVFEELNIYQPGDAVAAVDSTKFLRLLNLMMGQWAQQHLTIPAVSRQVFPLVSNKGSSTNPYTVGTNGDLNTPRPPNQNSVTAAGLLLNVSSPPVEIPRGVMTTDGWNMQRIKDLTSTLFTDIYYRPDFAGNPILGSLFLWPVPTDTTNSLVLYTKAALTTFADLTTAYSIPDGYDEALYLNIARRVARPFGRVADETLRADAYNALMTIKRSNIQPSDLQNDFGTLGTGHTSRGYNLQTGE